MAVVIDGTNGISTPDLESAGPVTGTTGTFSGAVSGATASFSGNVTLGSSVLATPTGTAPAYLCRAWVNFNGTGTVAIRASGNVSSITDNGTGNYTVNMTTAMPDTNYVVTALADFTLGSDGLPFVATNSDGTSGSKTTSAFGITSFVPAFNLSDVQGMYIAVFR